MKVRSRGYSLIELMVVLGVLALLAATGLPNFFGANDRYLLDNAANQVRQLLLEARVRSLAPHKSQGEAPGAAQFYQVRFGDFSETGGIQDNLAIGNSTTTEAVLEKGLTECSNSEIGGVTELRSLRLPNAVFIQSFFPAITTNPEDYETAIRFVAGKPGYRCGATDNLPLPESLVSGKDDQWVVKLAPNINQKALSSVSYVELKSARLTSSRFVVINRYTADVSISRVSPNINFEPLGDGWPPVWQQPESATVVALCRGRDARLVLRYSRAVDQFSGEGNQAVQDPARPVYYDINFAINNQLFQPLVRRFAFDQSPAGDIITYSFITGQVSIPNQPQNLRFELKAYDRYGHTPQSNRALNFVKGVHWQCTTVNPGTGATDPPSDVGGPNPGTSGGTSSE